VKAKEGVVSEDEGREPNDKDDVVDDRAPQKQGLKHCDVHRILRANCFGDNLSLIRFTVAFFSKVIINGVIINFVM
jgi:hypothetical protein